MAVPIKKGVEFDCDMFNVRCKQQCVSGGLRHTDKCPYDNYKQGANPKIPKGYSGTYAKNSSGGDTLIMVTSTKSISGDTPKGAKSMANDKKSGNNPAANGGNGNGNFQPTFRKYADMSDSEKAAFRQGAKTSENKVKERLGFTKPKN